MKIKGQIPKVPMQDKAAQKGKEAENAKAQEKKASSLKKSVSDQFAINKLKAKIETESDMDMKKVKELREKIKKGEYKIDKEKLASNLLKDSLLEDIS